MRACRWCEGPIPEASRVDAKFCSKSHRQAAHRALIRRAAIDHDGRRLRLAYADPPYPGLARRYYAGHPDYAGEVDHGELLSRLATYDGWALSTSARALPHVLSLAALLGLAVRVAAWITGARPHLRAAVLNGWEPVIYSPARSVVPAGQTTDVLLGVAPRRRPTLPRAVTGMKPPAFSVWVFELMGAGRGDSLDDLYPGSGIVARTWREYQGTGDLSRHDVRVAS